MISEEEVIKELIKQIAIIQEVTGEEFEQVTKKTEPFNDLAGFESMRLAITVDALFDELRIDVKLSKLSSIFPGINATIEEIAKAIISIAKEKKDE